MEQPENNSASFYEGSLSVVNSGLYTGRLRNNSERSERRARDKEKGKSPSKLNQRSKSLKNIKSQPIATKDIRSFLPSKPVHRSQCNPAKTTEQRTWKNPGQPPATIENPQLISTKTNSIVKLQVSTPGVSLDKSTDKHNMASNNNHQCAETNNTTGENCNPQSNQLDKNPGSHESNTNNQSTPPQKGNPAEKMKSEEEKQIDKNEEEIVTLKKKVLSLKEGTMERMLLEMQLDTKQENIVKSH